MKMGVENGIFWCEIGSGFGERGGTPLPRIPRSSPAPRELRRFEDDVPQPRNLNEHDNIHFIDRKVHESCSFIQISNADNSSYNYPASSLDSWCTRRSMPKIHSFCRCLCNLKKKNDNFNKRGLTLLI